MQPGSGLAGVDGSSWNSSCAREYPPNGGRRAGCPARRLPGAGAGFQAVAGGADQLSPVAARQPPGGERAGPGPARGVPADLVRAAAAAPAADRVDPDVERVHGSPLTESQVRKAARVTGNHGLAPCPDTGRHHRGT
jgi:hypothetical protein